MGRPRPSRAALPGPQQACVGRRKAHTRPKTEVAEGSRRTYIVRLRSPNGRSFAFPIPSLQFLSLSLSLSLFLSSSPERRYEFAVGKVSRLAPSPPSSGVTIASLGNASSSSVFCFFVCALRSRRMRVARGRREEEEEEEEEEVRPASRRTGAWRSS
ncbi:hypothetical protein ACJRO7_011906 [Eucalyptus globulus]|uniref:Uncharacterized protein n=1 Tax=Eucalyptus globulus TaxID=34317 RepID=A0ABD3LHX2_EUCGL